MEFLNVKNIIAKRQSLFAQQMEIGATIEQEKIWKLLELGNYAPSHRRTQPWRFSVFEKEAKNDFFETLASIYKSTTSKELFEEKKEQK